MTTVHLGLLWQRFRDQLPIVEEHPLLPPVFEKFDPPAPPRAEITVEDKPPVPRLWFLNRQKTELIQVQTDRFIHNWRKTEGIEPYPRFEPIRDRFRREVEVLREFVADEGLGALAVNQCEVTYVNHIEPAGVWERTGQWEKVFRVCRRLPEGAFLPEAEEAGFRALYVMRGNDGTPIGRLHVAVQPAWKRSDNSPIFTMNLIARGAPLGDGIDGAFSFFELGREWIVKGFADLTTDAMQRAWEKEANG